MELIADTTQNNIVKVLMIRAIVAATMMSGCIEHIR